MHSPFFGFVGLSEFVLTNEYFIRNVGIFGCLESEKHHNIIRLTGAKFVLELLQ